MIIKKFPEDFIVEEIPLGFSGIGDYAVYLLTKKGYNTESSVDYICKRFGIQRRNIKYSGSKDKHALTKQYISIFKDKGDLKLDNDDLKLDFISFHDEPLSLGTLHGNKFNIKIRELSVEEMRLFEEHFRQDFIFPNYFDDQRFSENNFEIGLSILKRDFKNACALAGLEVNNNDYVSALKSIPSKTLLFYIHAVQSYLFNKELSEKVMDMGEYYLRDYRHGQLAFLNYKDYDSSLKNLKLVGFDPDNQNEALLSDIGLTSRDFIIRQFPELSVEGIERDCLVRTNVFYKMDKTENINEIDLEFSLPKGSYATMLIKALF